MKLRFPACGTCAEFSINILNSQTYDFAIKPIQSLDSDELSKKPDFSGRQVIRNIRRDDPEVVNPLQVGSQ